LTFALPSLDLPEYLVFLLETGNSSLPASRLTEPEMLVISFVEYISTTHKDPISTTHQDPTTVISPFSEALLSHPTLLSKEIFCLLLRFLLHMTTDTDFSVPAVKFLLRLMKDEKYAELCMTELLQLDIELLRAINLNYLFVSNPKMNETVFEVLCLLKQRLSRLKKSNLLVNIVSCSQLNEDSIAIGTFIQEYRTRFVYF
jgi:hypothetical protein